MNRRSIAVLVAAWPAMSLACGVCDEDKIAAVYDHAAVRKAGASGHDLVFVAVDGPVNATAFMKRVAAEVRNMPGVRPGSLRSSVAPAAFVLALQRDEQTPAGALTELQRRLGSTATLRIVRVIEPNQTQ